MKIFIVPSFTTVIVASIFGIFTANSVTAQWTPNDSMFEGYSNDRLNRMNQPGNRNSDGTVKGTTLSPAARIGKKTSVMYIKDETIDTDNLLDALQSKNLEIGFAQVGEEITVLQQNKKMRKVRFNESGRLGWVLETAIVGL